MSLSSSEKEQQNYDYSAYIQVVFLTTQHHRAKFCSGGGGEGEVRKSNIQLGKCKEENTP